MNNPKRMSCKRLLLIFIISFSIVGYAFSVASNTSQGGKKHYLKKYNFTTDWFTTHIRLWKKVLADFKNKPNIHYLEIGVFEGRSLIWMLENILTHPTAKATALDIFPRKLQEGFLANLSLSGFTDKVTVIKGASQNKLKNLSPHSFDIIYIDGDHIAPSVLTDAILSWPLLKKEGILIFDDYHWKETKSPPDKRPKIAIDAFINNFRQYIEIIQVCKQYIIKKKEIIYWEY